MSSRSQRSSKITKCPNDAAFHNRGAFSRSGAAARSGVQSEADRDSGISSTSQTLDDDDNHLTLAKSLAETDYDASYNQSSSRSYSPPSYSPYSSPSSSSTPPSRMVMIPRCAAPRDRVIAKYPPPFHPDATPNGRINFHVAVKKACLSHHSKVLWYRPFCQSTLTLVRLWKVSRTS